MVNNLLFCISDIVIPSKEPTLSYQHWDSIYIMKSNREHTAQSLSSEKPNILMILIYALSISSLEFKEYVNCEK